MLKGINLPLILDLKLKYCENWDFHTLITFAIPSERPCRAKQTFAISQILGWGITRSCWYWAVEHCSPPETRCKVPRRRKRKATSPESPIFLTDTAQALWQHNWAQSQSSAPPWTRAVSGTGTYPGFLFAGFSKTCVCQNKDFPSPGYVPITQAGLATAMYAV